MGGPGANSKGDDFYGPYDARDAAVEVQSETGMNCLSFEMQVYSPDDDCYYPSNEIPNGKDGKPKKVLKLSGTEVRKRLKTGEEIPAWFSYPHVVEILRQAHPPNHKKGLTIFFTGLSGSGKSTIANALCEKLMEVQERRVSILDGDYMRKLVSSELGFSEEHRNLNIKRIGFISSLIAHSGGLAIAAPILRTKCRVISSVKRAKLKVDISSAMWPHRSIYANRETKRDCTPRHERESLRE